MAVTLPIVNDSEGVWGTILNSAITDIDNRLILATNTNAAQDTSIADLATRITALDKPPLCRLVQNATQAAIPNNIPTAVPFNAEDLDPLAFHNPAQPTRITPTVAGWYRVTGSIVFPGRSDWTSALAYITKSGALPMPTLARHSWAPNTSGTAGFVLTTDVLVSMDGATDYLEVIIQAVNVASAAFTLTATSVSMSTFQAIRVSGL